MFKKVFFSFLCVIILLSLFLKNDVSYLDKIGKINENYYGKYSSQCAFYKSGLSFIKTGESVTTYLTADEIIKEFSATIVHTETVGENVNIFAYSKRLPKKVRINGKVINLHIFLSKNQTVVGSPLIFGSH